MPRALNVQLTMFCCPHLLPNGMLCGRVLTLIHLPSVMRPITLTCPDCGGETRIGPERARVAERSAIERSIVGA